MIHNMRTIWYFGLEPLKERYTYQLCEEWMPEAFKPHLNDELQFVPVKGEPVDDNITVGSVLDATGRGIYSLTQCSALLKAIRKGEVKDNDILLLQDFWTPGIESIFYALELYGVDVKVYATCWAQSVDEYDFTYCMKGWMRFYELGLDKKLSGIFVGSSVHKDQLKQAGFEAPIHVVSLTIHKKKTVEKLPNFRSLKKEQKIIYSSRLDKEKNPYFMLEVAEKFLSLNPSAEWVVTTSGKKFVSTIDGFVDDMYKLARKNSRFVLKSNLTKEEYYTELATAQVQFNSALQDYVSWTIIESTVFGCKPVFPKFRSFPEFLPVACLYKPFFVNDAIAVLTSEFYDRTSNFEYISDLSDLGRRLEAWIIVNDYKGPELNVWFESAYIERLVEK